MQEEAGATLTDTDPTGSSGSPPRTRLYAVIVGLALLTLGVDQVSKMWALSSLAPGASRDLLGSVLRLRLIRNPGAAFSLGDGVTWVLTLVALAIVVWIVVMARRVGHLWWAVALGLLLGGAWGNLLDRLLRAPGLGRGHVVDFIDYAGLFVGNVADIAIVAAAAVIVVLSLRGIAVTGRSGSERQT